jgi:hypothetical protein
MCLLFRVFWIWLALLLIRLGSSMYVFVNVVDECLGQPDAQRFGYILYLPDYNILLEKKFIFQKTPFNVDRDMLLTSNRRMQH